MVRLTDCPDMTFGVYRGRKTTIQQQQIRKAKIAYNLYTTQEQSSLKTLLKWNSQLHISSINEIKSVSFMITSINEIKIF